MSKDYVPYQPSLQHIVELAIENHGDLFFDGKDTDTLAAHITEDYENSLITCIDVMKALDTPTYKESVQDVQYILDIVCTANAEYMQLLRDELDRMRLDKIL